MRLPVSAIGSLMTEHRLIERCLEQMRGERTRIAESGSVDLDRIDTIVEFLSVYADRNHHGKEEDILFKRLAEKDMSPEHAEVMQQLIDGHRYGREQVKGVREANGRARSGDDSAAGDISDRLQKLIEFYPEHIELEDHHFFKPAINYFTPEERTELEEQFEAFDRLLLHSIYEEKLAFLEEAAERVPSTLT